MRWREKGGQTNVSLIRRSLFLPLPDLPAADRRYTNITTHLQFLAASKKGNDCVINLTILWIENFSIFPGGAVPFRAPQNRHPLDRLILPFALAWSAKRMRTLGRFKHLQHFAG